MHELSTLYILSLSRDTEVKILSQRVPSFLYPLIYTAKNVFTIYFKAAWNSRGKNVRQNTWIPCHL